MLTDENKKYIESLDLKEMEYELNLGHRSRFQKDKFAYLKTCYQQKKESGLNTDSVTITIPALSDLQFLRFLILHDKNYRNLSLSIITTTVITLVALLQFDFSNLIEAQLLTPEQKAGLLLLGPVAIVIIGLIALFSLNRHTFKKWRNARNLSKEDLSTLNRYYGHK